jgi:hypothetical protein
MTGLLVRERLFSTGRQRLLNAAVATSRLLHTEPAMRNGIYRVWMKGPGGASSGAIVFKNGDIFAVDPMFAFNGRYRERAGRVTAEILCKRLYQDPVPSHLPDLETFHLKLEGAAGGECAQMSGSIDEVPGLAISFEYAFLCEA